MIGTEAWKGKYIYSQNEDLATIAERESKIGTAIEKATDAPEGLLNLNATPELTRFFNRGQTITCGIASSASMYSRTKALAEAFDAIFFVRESTPLKVRALYGFNLELELDKEKQGNTLNGKTITLGCSATFSTLDSFQPNEGVELNVKYLDKNHERIDYEATKLLPDDKVEQAYTLPEGTVYTQVNFSGSKVKDFFLTDFTINGISIQEQDFKLVGERYIKSSFKGDSLPASASGVIQVSLEQ